MSKYVLIKFPDESMIHQGIEVLKKVHAQGGIKLYASSIVAKDSNGQLSVQKIIKEGLGGTVVGALIGGLAGLPMGPLGMTIGATGGALVGVSADLLEEGDEGKFTQEISRNLTAGKAVIVAEVDEDGLTAFEALMAAIGGTVIRK